MTDYIPHIFGGFKIYQTNSMLTERAQHVILFLSPKYLLLKEHICSLLKWPLI